MPRTSIDCTNLYYEKTGQGQPLLFIHGLGSSTQDWAAQVDAFSTKYQAVTFDLRGHGQSDKPAGPYSIALFASDTAALLSKLGIESAHVVGISLGGAVAFQLAIDSPSLVTTLTIVNSAPAMAESAEQAKAEIDRRVNIVQQMGMRAMGEALAPNLFPGPDHEALRRIFVERWAENDPRAYIDSTLSMLDWNVTGQISSIHCPTLILSADQDYTPIAVKEAYARLMPDSKVVVIPNTHHAIPMEAPALFNAALMEFLSKHA